MLFITGSRVLFKPNIFEAFIGLKQSEWSREELVAADVASRGWNPISGALRRRLRLTLQDGAVLLFVVENASSIITKLDLRR